MAQNTDVRDTSETAQEADTSLTTADIAGKQDRDQTSVGSSGGEENRAPLFPENESRDFRTRWDSIQASFVDEPRRAVQDADSLVATAMKRLAEQFSEERSRLESQWDKGDDVSTEDLRIALQRYRSFFGRLLSM